MFLRSKLPEVGVTIFTTMTQLANEHGACNLSQGFPDFDVPSGLMELVEKHMRAGHNQYAPMQGVALLRERIAEKVFDLYGARVNPETDVTVTSGATEALFAAITAVVHPGDAVIVLEPAYDSYVPAIELSGGRPIYLKMSFPGYRIDWNAVADAAKEARLLVLNSNTLSSTAGATRACCATRSWPSAVSSSAPSAKPITPPAGRSATVSRRPP
jgi:methionine aminotransferase